MKKLIYVIVAVFAFCFLLLPFITGQQGKEVRVEDNVEQNQEKIRDNLGLDSSCVFMQYNGDEPGIKALFYIAEGKQDTFHYAVTEEDSVFLWAVVSGKYVHLVRELSGERKDICL